MQLRDSGRYGLDFEIHAAQLITCTDYGAQQSKERDRLIRLSEDSEVIVARNTALFPAGDRTDRRALIRFRGRNDPAGAVGTAARQMRMRQMTHRDQYSLAAKHSRKLNFAPDIHPAHPKWVNRGIPNRTDWNRAL